MRSPASWRGFRPVELRRHGTNSAGQPVASGIYFYQALAAGRSDTRRMLLLK